MRCDITLYFLTDFSATYTCSGQDEATCAQRKTALQLVFVVAYSDDNGKQINELFHFWGEVIMYFITIVKLKYSRFFKTDFQADFYAGVDSQTAVRSNSNRVILHLKLHFFVSNVI